MSSSCHIDLSCTSGLATIQPDTTIHSREHKVDETWGMEAHKLRSTSGTRPYLILMELCIPTHIWYLHPFGAIVDHSCTLAMLFASTEFTLSCRNGQPNVWIWIGVSLTKFDVYVILEEVTTNHMMTLVIWWGGYNFIHFVLIRPTRIITLIPDIIWDPIVRAWHWSLPLLNFKIKVGVWEFLMRPTTLWRWQITWRKLVHSNHLFATCSLQPMVR